MLALGESVVGDEFDLDALKEAIPTKTSDELIAMIESGTDGYAEEAVAAAQAELVTRGVSYPPSEEEIRDAKARLYDQMISTKLARQEERLSKFLQVLCLTEGWLFSFICLFYLRMTGRKQAAKRAAHLATIGWLVKGAIFMAWAIFVSSS